MREKKGRFIIIAGMLVLVFGLSSALKSLSAAGFTASTMPKISTTEGGAFSNPDAYDGGGVNITSKVTSERITTQPPTEEEHDRPEPAERPEVNPAIVSWSKKLDGEARWELVLDGFAVLDHETGLVWEQSPDTTSRSWTMARHHCFSKKVGGRRGWYLPTLSQLTSIVDDTQVNPSLPSGHLFSNVNTQWYWSTTTSSFNSHWGVDFGNFNLGRGRNDSIHKSAWCVRGGRQGHDAY